MYQSGLCYDEFADVNELAFWLFWTNARCPTVMKCRTGNLEVRAWEIETYDTLGLEVSHPPPKVEKFQFTLEKSNLP